MEYFKSNRGRFGNDCPETDVESSPGQGTEASSSILTLNKPHTAKILGCMIKEA